MHRQLEQHARKEAFRFRKHDVEVFRAILHLWFSFCTSAVQTLVSICALLISVHPFRAGAQWFFRYTIEIKHAVCRLLHSKDIANLHPGQKIQWQDLHILDSLTEAYAEALRAHLESHGIPEED